MRTGPYTKPIFERIVERLISHKIPYQEFLDQELLQELESEWKEKVNAHPSRGGDPALRHDPACMFIDIAESDFASNQQILENMGIYAPHGEEPSFEAQDFICPKCKFNSHESGLCPRDNINLIPWDEYRKQQAADDKPLISSRDGQVLGIVIAVLAIIYAVWTFLQPK